MFKKLQEQPDSIPEQESSYSKSWDINLPTDQVPQVAKIMSPLDVNTIKSIERQNNSQRSMDIYKPFFLEYSLMGEYVLLHRQNISGAYILPSAGSPLKWFGVLFIRQGLYQGGIFRFTLYIPDNFPDCDCPILVFEPSIFHPLIDLKTGELDVKRGFPQKWRRNSCHLWQVIQFAKHIFSKLETNNPLNQEAATLYEKDLELYKLKVAENMNMCQELLYEKPVTEDNHAIWFLPWNPSLHEDVRQKLLAQKSRNYLQEENSKEFSSGLSWIQKGSSTVFSKKEL